MARTMQTAGKHEPGKRNEPTKRTEHNARAVSSTEQDALQSEQETEPQGFSPLLAARTDTWASEQGLTKNVQEDWLRGVLNAFTGPFRFADLPAELRVQVYEKLLPHGETISFLKKWYPKYRISRAGILFHVEVEGKPKWKVMGLRDDEALLDTEFGRVELKPSEVDNVIDDRSDAPFLYAGLALFMVNRLISEEACAILYGKNTFHFSLIGSPKELFGPLGLPHRLHLLRNLRQIELEVSEYARDTPSHWPMKQHRERLQQFVKVLRQHAADDAKSSLLTKLSVKMWIKGGLRDPGRYEDPVIFATEELIALRGIENVEITGVPAWYAECLRCCIQGRGGDVKKHKYPRVRKRVDMLMQSVSAKKCYNPIFDWGEFAERNGIELPDHFSEYYAKGVWERPIA